MLEMFRSRMHTDGFKFYNTLTSSPNTKDVKRNGENVTAYFPGGESSPLVYFSVYLKFSIFKSRNMCIFKEI